MELDPVLPLLRWYHDRIRRVRTYCRRDKKCKRGRRPWYHDQCYRYWCLRLRHLYLVPLLHPRLGHAVLVERSSAFRPDLCVGFGQRTEYLHDHHRCCWSHPCTFLLSPADGLCINNIPQSTSVAIVAASRLIYAVARDGVLPLSGWIGQVDSSKQPRNAVTVMFIFGACILCTILPSQVAFTSLISAGGIPTTAAYGLIALLRLTMTPNDFKSSHFYLGRWRKLFYISTILFNGLIFAVSFIPRKSNLKQLIITFHLRPKSLPSSSPSPPRLSTSPASSSVPSPSLVFSATSSFLRRNGSARVSSRRLCVPLTSRFPLAPRALG